MEQLEAGELPSRYLERPVISSLDRYKFLEPGMRVVIYAQDLSGRRDDGYYTKPDLSSALDLFFDPEKVDTFLDDEGDTPLLRKDAEETFHQDKRITFYNAEGEKVVISYDPTA